MNNDLFRIIIVPGEFNRVDGENLLLVLTENEFERARFRGETVLRNRSAKGEVNLDELFGSGIALS